MIEIVIDNVNTKFKGIDRKTAKIVQDAISEREPNYFFNPKYKSGQWDGYYRPYNLVLNTLPTGLLPQAIAKLEELQEEFQLTDVRNVVNYFDSWYENIELVASQKQLRDYQVQSVNDFVNSKCNGVLFQRGVLNLATNAGKTVIAEAIVQELYDKIKGNQRFLFVTHSKEIAYQAQKSFEVDLGIPVGFIGDGKWNEEKFTIAMIPTLLSKLKKKHEVFTNLSQNVIGFIGDEIHHSSSNSWIEILNTFKNAVIRLGLTGTVDTGNPVNKLKLFGVTGGVITKVSNEYLIDRGFSAKPECFMVSIDYPDIDAHVRYAFSTNGDDDELSYQDAYFKGIVSNAYRNFIIATICQREYEQGGQTLVLVERIDHGILIGEMLDALSPDLSYVFLHGELSSEERQFGLQRLTNGEVDVVISTAILDEGVDVPNINALIYARGMKSNRKLLQGIGRGLRKKSDGSSVHVYDFIDDVQAKLLQHSLQRYKVLKAENFDIRKMTVEEITGVSIEKLDNIISKYDTTFDDTYIYVE